ncbi:hypothetical protein JHK87_001378 [Glycine soja]|nr:hypothetical protein JHK87_001378 [Glycine soja]
MMYQPRNEVHCRNLMVETTGAIVRFKKVVSLLNSGLGHARLYLCQNYMFGEVPEELGNLVSLEELVIYSNNLTGRIPSSIGKLKQLRVIRAGLNALLGPIPAEISECESLEILGRFL